LGEAFDRALVSTEAEHKSEMTEIAERLARLEAWRGEVDSGGHARLASAAGDPPEPEG
jgi:hypothetical protein